MQLLPSLTEPFFVRVVGCAVLCALAVSACSPEENRLQQDGLNQRHDAAATEDNEGVATEGDAGASKPLDDDPCLNEVLFKVDGEQLRPLGGTAQTLDHPDNQFSAPPFVGRPDIEPRAKTRVSLQGNAGKAELLWNDAVVASFVIDSDFVANYRSGVLPYNAPDGTHLEYHIYVRPLCTTFPDRPLTRAEVALIEK